MYSDNSDTALCRSLLSPHSGHVMGRNPVRGKETSGDWHGEQRRRSHHRCLSRGTASDSGAVEWPSAGTRRMGVNKAFAAAAALARVCSLVNTVLFSPPVM